MNQDEFIASLRSEGFEVKTGAFLEPGRLTSGHTHPFEVRVLVTSGEITLTVDDVPTTYRPGESFHLPAHYPHAEAVGPEGMGYTVGRRVPA